MHAELAFSDISAQRVGTVDRYREETVILHKTIFITQSEATCE
jgi:hypothetical protein